MEFYCPTCKKDFHVSEMNVSEERTVSPYRILLVKTLLPWMGFIKELNIVAHNVTNSVVRTQHRNLCLCRETYDRDRSGASQVIGEVPYRIRD